MFNDDDPTSFALNSHFQRGKSNADSLKCSYLERDISTFNRTFKTPIHSL